MNYISIVIPLIMIVSLQVKITEPSEGFKISFHDHLEAGNVGNTGFVVSPGLQYFIQLGYREVSEQCGYRIE